MILIDRVSGGSIGRGSRFVVSASDLHHGDARHFSSVNSPVLSRDYIDADVLHR